MDKQAYLAEIDRVIADGPFQDNWDSLGAYVVPDWYKAAKFGIFIHWGVYSVPAFEDEWYPLKTYVKGSPAYEHHVKTYGPHKEFGYKDFIPQFTAEAFDAGEWMRLFEEAGARYVVPVAEHHDGFQMYESELSQWNAKAMGPKRDVLGELARAASERGITLGASSHRVEHWFFMGHGREFDSDVNVPLTPEDLYWPAMPEPSHQDLYSQPTPDDAFMEDWLLRCCEIVDRYKPRLVYFDWWIQHHAVKPWLKKFAAYYYNRAAQWGMDVAINYKHDAFMLGCAVPTVERGQFADVKPYFWQSDTSTAKNSWSYTDKNVYKKAGDLLCDLCDVVAKNGTLLLNIGPKADGSIPAEEAAILREMGGWLKDNGEAIYATKTWRVAGEGPTVVAEGHFTDGQDKAFTHEDIRFTVKGGALYAAVLRYPEDGRVLIRSLAEQGAVRSPLFHGIIQSVSILGFNEIPAWKQTGDGLLVTTRSVKSDKPVVIKVIID